MENKIYPLMKTFALNTGLAVNCFDGIDNRTSEKRISSDTNPMKFIFLHLIDARYYILKLIESKEKSPFADLTDNADSIDDIKKYPSLEEMIKAWRESDKIFKNELSNVDENLLMEKSQSKFPINDETIFGALMFLCQHESFHVGQLSLLRKYHAYPAMKYF